MLEKELEAAKAERMATFEKLATSERMNNSLRTELNETTRRLTEKSPVQP